MKRFSLWVVPTVLLVISLSFAAFAGGEARKNVPPGGLWIYDAASDEWRPAEAGSSYATIASVPNDKRADVATNTVTFISSIASITPPCSVEVSCPAGELWIGPATTTVDAVKYHVIEEKQSRVYNVGTSTWDRGLVGASALSSASVTIHPLTH